MDGITNPPIDELLDKSGSKYSLVLYAAKPARSMRITHNLVKVYLNMLDLLSRLMFMKNLYQLHYVRSMKVYLLTKI